MGMMSGVSGGGPGSGTRTERPGREPPQPIDPYSPAIDPYSSAIDAYSSAGAAPFRSSRSKEFAICS